jgi:hypothetical protein
LVGRFSELGGCPGNPSINLSPGGLTNLRTLRLSQGSRYQRIIGAINSLVRFIFNISLRNTKPKINLNTNSELGKKILKNPLKQPMNNLSILLGSSI